MNQKEDQKKDHKGSRHPKQDQHDLHPVHVKAVKDQLGPAVLEGHDIVGLPGIVEVPLFLPFGKARIHGIVDQGVVLVDLDLQVRVLPDPSRQGVGILGGEMVVGDVFLEFLVIAFVLGLLEGIPYGVPEKALHRPVGQEKKGPRADKGGGQEPDQSEVY